ncbi:flagellar basal body rod protein FlgB [Alicyclobacillaceae bacterium I2511]|nr:flagellar basal body rod protein FlgB [Alicyclobacillaceae bacterium I2511]
MNPNIAAISVLQHAMDAANLRQQVYANNIANAQTPGFKSSNVEFQSLLSQALLTPGQASNPASTSAVGQTPTLNWAAGVAVQPQVVTDTQTKISNNGNNVNIDAQMAQLAENQVYYNTLLQATQMQLAQFQTAITG